MLRSSDPDVWLKFVGLCCSSRFSHLLNARKHRVHSEQKLRIIITQAGCIAAGLGRAFSRVCLFVCLSVFVRALRGKQLEPSTPNLVYTYTLYFIAVARHALTQRSKGQSSRSNGYENRHGRTVASDVCCYGRVLLLPAWVRMSIRLPMFYSLNL